MELSSTGIAIFSAYLVVLIIIGIVASRYQKSSEDFWVAGRRFGLVVMVMALMASVMHGGSILSGVAAVGRFGGIAILAYPSFALGFLIILVWFAKKLRNLGGFTLPDYMGERFESNFLRGYSAIVVALSSILYLIAQIRVMGFVLRDLLGLRFEYCLVLGTVIFVFYVALGGLLAVVWTNIAQFIFMWIGLLVLLPSVGSAVGGWTEVMTKVDEVAPGWTSPTGTTWSVLFVISWYMIWLVAYATRVELITKVYAAKDTRVARFALPITILLVMIFLLYGNLYLGAAARVLIWDQISRPDQAFSTLVTTVCAPFLASIALTGIASAAMSTTDSLLLMSGASIAHDLVRKCYHEPRGIVKSEKFYLNISRLSIFAVGLIALLLSFRTPALILEIVSYAVALIGATFFFPLLVGLQWKRTSKSAAIVSALIGSLMAIVWSVCQVAEVTWARSMHAGMPAIIVSGILILAVTFFTRPVSAKAIQKFF